ncbi:aminopeptidase [Candidatus Nanohaloarchaea archaeon]|nr:aminopeptidase [Candidatus Nanohaloarchaea archaeon]
MSLVEGAETIVNQCLNVQDGEEVLVVNDGNDSDLIDALFEVIDSRDVEGTYIEYEEPENHGEEPPEKVADAMQAADVVIAPTKKSLSHTDARREACDAGSRVATLPGINKTIWNSSLQADYSEVERISEKVYELLEDTDEVRITTPSGTDLTFEIDIDLFHTDTGIIHEPGDFGNLPAGEADGGILNVNGTLVTDHFPFAPEGTEVEIEDSEAVAVKHVGDETSGLAEAFENIEGARNLAEFGFGTNPKATLIGNVLQDEKVLGTVHIAFGDNSSYMPDGHERKVSCDIHWDTVCEKPTVWFDDRKVLDRGETVFMNE